MVFGEIILPPRTDFSGKAERRGVQRASVELALNILATNTEQLRPLDKFRKVRLPPKYQPPLEEVPLWLPLEPYKRPIEMPTYKYTNIMRRYREWKDDDYEEACNQADGECLSALPPQDNFLGPSMLNSDKDLERYFEQQQQRLLALQRSLVAAEKAAPRPFIRRLLIRLNQGLADSAPDDFVDNVPLSEADFAILQDMASDSWYNEVIPHDNQIPGIDTELFHEFERDMERFIVEIPFWTSSVDLDDKFEPHGYNSEEASEIFIRLTRLEGSEVNSGHTDDLLQRINNLRIEKSNGLARPWTMDEAISFLTAMQNSSSIQ